jgi:hypothetical protein
MIANWMCRGRNLAVSDMAFLLSLKPLLLNFIFRSPVAHVPECISDLNAQTGRDIGQPMAR